MLTPNTAPRGFMPPLRVAAGLAAATLLMTIPFVNWQAFGSSIFVGDARLMAWTIAWNCHAMLNGLPIYDANIYYPASGALTYTDPMIGISLFALPIYAFTQNAIATHNVLLVAAFWLNAWSMASLAWRETGDQVAALVAGLIYACSFYMMLHGHGHLSLIWAWPLPLLLVAIDSWIVRPTVVRLLVWVVLLVLQVLASWYLAIIAIVITGVALAWHAAFHVRDRWMLRIVHLIAAAAASAALVWPLAAPYRQSLDSPSLAEVRGMSADWPAYLIPPLNSTVGRWWTAYIDGAPRWIWGETTLFIGYVALILAAGGLLTRNLRHDWRRRGMYFTIGAVALMLSFGPAAEGNSPSAFDLLRLVPGTEGFRAPARFALGVVFGVAALAAWATVGLRRRFGRRADACLIVLVPVMLLEWFVVDFPTGRPPTVTVPEIYSHPAISRARAIVSLPDYRNTPSWPLGATYLLYSTTHWRPIVNGYGRGQPSDHASVISHMRAFPGPNNARTMRRLGVDLVVLHGDQLGDEIDSLVATALETREYELLAVQGNDYLFRVRAEAPPAP